jgi:hypothetical protein
MDGKNKPSPHSLLLWMKLPKPVQFGFHFGRTFQMSMNFHWRRICRIGRIDWMDWKPSSNSQHLWMKLPIPAPFGFSFGWTFDTSNLDFHCWRNNQNWVDQLDGLETLPPIQVHLWMKLPKSIPKMDFILDEPSKPQIRTFIGRGVSRIGQTNWMDWSPYPSNSLHLWMKLPKLA